MRGQLTNSICTSGYSSAGVSLGQKDQTQIKKLDQKRLCSRGFCLTGFVFAVCELSVTTICFILLSFCSFIHSKYCISAVFEAWECHNRIVSNIENLSIYLSVSNDVLFLTLAWHLFLREMQADIHPA